MRSYSIYTILLLCLAILIVDVVAFYWLGSITALVSVAIKQTINGLFWIFSFGLIASILILKIRLDTINPIRKQQWINSLYGLTVSSFIPKFIFIVIISILYIFNYFISEKVSMLVIPLVGLFSGFLPFFIILYGIFRTLYFFEVHHVKIKFENLPKAFHKIRLVQISDIHLGSFNARYHIFDKAIAKINHLKPDYIFFTGDLVNNYAWELKGWKDTFNTLVAKKGKYAVLGNHDYGDYSEWDTIEEKQENFEAIKQFYKTIGFKLLLNEAEIIERSGEYIAIIGVENWGNPPFKQYGDLKNAMAEVDSIPFKILLSHDPSHWQKEVVNKTNIALTLSGHTHGMQAGFQFKNFNWSPIKYKYKEWAGLYKEKNQCLYVNRGLGWLGFPGRLGMRPEITCIELNSTV